jgi:hypothetical protein
MVFTVEEIEAGFTHILTRAFATVEFGEKVTISKGISVSPAASLVNRISDPSDFGE